MRLTTQAQRALDTAERLSANLGHAYIGADHLAVGLLQERDGEAIRALKLLRVPLGE